jgi:hypothetical protein
MLYYTYIVGPTSYGILFCYQNHGFSEFCSWHHLKYSRRLMGDKPLHICLPSCILSHHCLRSEKVQGRGEPIWQGEDISMVLSNLAKWHNTHWKKLLDWQRKFRGCNVKYISQLLAINNFRSKAASTTDTKSNEKICGSWYRLTHHDERAGKKGLVSCNGFPYV